jgi:mannitol 2-dehydrogenase
MEYEVAPILDAVPGIDLDAYRSTLLERFSNPNIKDQLTRIVSETSAKAPKFLVATINDQLALSGGDVRSVRRCVLVLAAWCRYLELSVGDETAGRAAYVIQDAERVTLVEHAVASTREGNACNFLRIRSLFGDLVDNAAFVALYEKLLLAIRNKGIVAVLTNITDYV